MDKVSIIMPLYNSEKFILSSVESVRRQTYPKWELIMVDDASTDRSLKIAKRLAKEDVRIKVFGMPENKGVSSARNLGLSKAQGRYVAFLDSDDIWGKNKLTVQIISMRKRKSPLSCTGYAYINENGTIMPLGWGKVDHSIGLEKYMKTTQIGASTVMIDRAQVPSFSFPNDRELCEDARLWMNFMRQGYQFTGLNKILALIRVREKSLSHNKIKMAQNTLKRYWMERDFPAYKRLYYFLNYAYHGFEKRLRPGRLNVKYVGERFWGTQKELL